MSGIYKDVKKSFLLFISFYSGQAQIHTKMPMLMSYPEMIQVNAKYYI